MPTIRIASDFAPTPGARYRNDGPFSGEEFREKFLEPLFGDTSSDEEITIYLDGTEGFATSFLEEAFGGLARKFGPERCIERLRFVSEEEPLLEAEIKAYIEAAHA